MNYIPQISFFSLADVAMQDGWPVALEKQRQIPWVKLHSHEFVEVAFVKQGYVLQKHISRNGEVTRRGLVQGDISTILLGERHEYEACKNAILYNVFLRAGWLKAQSTLAELPGWNLLFGERDCLPDVEVHFSGGVRQQVIYCLEGACQEWEKRQTGYETIVMARIQEFLVRIARSVEGRRQPFVEPSSKIMSAICELEDSAQQKISLEELAQLSNMSVPSFTRKFRETTGISPMQYQLQTRLQFACQLLKSGDGKIEEIAEQSGFSSASHLIKMFHRELGVTPQQYRKQK